MVIPGGHSESKKEISAQVQNIADQIKTELEGKVKGGGNKFNVYEVLEYKQQVVAGMVYHMKIRIDDLACNNCIHVRVFQPLQYTQQGPEIQKYKMHTTIEDPLEIL
ncbi:MAG: hypothetical protein ACI8RD_004898 [Bacillariaceae sp.]|jgi:hypothetical protein